MAGTQPALHSSTIVAMVSESVAATAAGAGAPVRLPAQVLSDLFDALAALMAEVNPANQDEHNAEIAKVKDQITQAKADLAAEGTKMAGLGVVPMVTVFRTPLICQTGLRSSWPVRNQRSTLRPQRR